MPRPRPRLSPRLAITSALVAATLGSGACKQAETAARQGGGGPRAAADDPGAVPAVLDTATLLARADSGRIQGAPSAPVWVIVASDFQCPFCKVWHDQTYPMIVRDYVRTGRVRIAYLNFPLSNHQHAVRTAEAAMCAAVQGRFWEMHDAIFDTQPRWSPMNAASASALLDSLAIATVPRVPEWRSCMTSHATLPLIQADYQRTSSAGVQSTPSFYIGNRGIAGAQPPQVFRDAIEEALAQARQP